MTTTNSRAGFRTNHARTGFTILELLIVITIMLAVTAMAIPLLAPSREDRRVNEASRIITSMFAGARSRAIEIGRPVGVTLERDPTNPFRVLTLSYAEVPPPFAGGFINSRIIIEGEPTAGDTDMSGTIDPGEFTDWNGNGYYDSGGFITSITADGSNPDTFWQGLIRPGDALKLNYQGYEYTLGLPAMFSGNLDANGYFNTLDPDNPWQLATIAGGAGAVGGVISDAVTVPKTPFVEDPSGSGTGVDGRFTPGTDVGGLPFQIIRGPQRSAGKTETLPETMCIDLAGTSTAADPFALTAYTGDITVMYNPGGSVDSIRWASGPQVAPIGPLFLLIGKTFLVGGNVAPKPGEPVYNWQDLDARWLMINHQSGLLASNPTTSVDTTLSADQQIIQSRSIAREGIKVGDK